LLFWNYDLYQRTPTLLGLFSNIPYLVTELLYVVLSPRGLLLSSLFSFLYHILAFIAALLSCIIITAISYMENGFESTFRSSNKIP